VHNKLATLLFGCRLVNLYYVGKRQAFSSIQAFFLIKTASLVKGKPFTYKKRQFVIPPIYEPTLGQT